MKQWSQVWAEKFNPDLREIVQERLHRERLDWAVVECSAFRDFDALLFSMNNHNYVPTLRPYKGDPSQLNAAIMLVRNELTKMGLRIYPSPEALKTW